MFYEKLNDLETLSASVGNRSDYVYGIGGNTSVKLNDRYMAIKASGLRIRQVTKETGYVIVDFTKVREYYKNEKPTSYEEYENYIHDCILGQGKETNLKPSIEVGFHSMLGRYVAHTHSAYSNLVCCTQEGYRITREILKYDYPWVWVPFRDPGFELSIEAAKQIKQFERETGKKPTILMLQNHGIVVSGEDLQETIKLHEELNEKLKNGLGLDGEYPKCGVVSPDEKNHISASPFVKEFLLKNSIGLDIIRCNNIHAEYITHLNSNCFLKDKRMTCKDGVVYYKDVSREEASIIEETLNAFAYIVSWADKLGLHVQLLPEEEVKYIMDCEDRKRRKVI
ncbi:MAG: class II aldolase/adducin family protein [Eubacteriales bacterium]|nr:class II aldolase/adducin family protein [Eubacteriales bacterium]